MYKKPKKSNFWVFFYSHDLIPNAFYVSIETAKHIKNLIGG
jgi:hypothetical protein